MELLSCLLSSVCCNRCQTNLLRQKEKDQLRVYFCKCGCTKRLLLKCIHCEKQFLIRPYLLRKTNYCSQKCYWTGTDRKKLRICQSCQKSFYAKENLIKKGYGCYCSRNCWFTLFEKCKKQLKCKQCKKEFLVTRAVYKKRPKFCSKVCKDDFERDYVTRVCQGCKRKFQLPRSDLNRGRGSFCTWECYKKYTGETSIEKTVRLYLQKLNEPFKQEVRFKRFLADFYLPNKNLIIECDGLYWHKSVQIKDRDRRKDEFLQSLGYKILRLSEEDIRKHRFESLQELLFT